MNNFENLTKTQLILLVLLVSFVTSLVTGVVSVTLIKQTPKPITQTISRVIEKAVPAGGGEGSTVETIIVTQEDLITELVEKTSPAVVSIVATKDVPVIEQFFVNPLEDDEFFRQLLPPDVLDDFRVPQFRQNGFERQEVSSGTGFFATRDGLVVTNKHVVEDKVADYTVIMNDGRKLPAEVLARDPMNDIAVLKVEGTEFNFVPLGSSDGLKVGQSVVVIGNALGEFQNTVSVGVVSGLYRTIIASGSASGPEELRQVIQTDAAINPGNSGGPVLDLSGRAIGISTAVATDAENVGFALPVKLVKRAINDVEDYGRIVYPYLGVRFVVVNEDVAKSRDLPVDYGVLLVESEQGFAVLPDSPADKAGLNAGDVIIKIGGKKIDKDSSLGDIVSEFFVGDEVLVDIIRDGKDLALDVILEERPNNF